MSKLCIGLTEDHQLQDIMSVNYETSSKQPGLTIHNHLQEAQPSWHEFFTQVICNEDPLYHQPNVIDATSNLLPKVLGKLGWDVHNGAE